MYVYKYECMCMYECVYVCVHVCMYVRVCVNIICVCYKTAKDNNLFVLAI